jgi:hypothetical protein
MYGAARLSVHVSILTYLHFPGHLRNFPKEYHDSVKTFLDRLLHQMQADVWSESTQVMTAYGASNINDLKTPNFVSGPMKSPLLNSKL